METEILNKIEESTETKFNKKIILYNDEFNSFDNVINSLIKYCKHLPEQAHQCSLIVHTKGKCDIKSGTFDDLLPIYVALQDNNLTVGLE